MKSTLKSKHILTFLLLLSLSSVLVLSQSDEGIEISDFQGHEDNQDRQNYQQQQQAYRSGQPSQQQMQYISQRRTACLVLSRYYLNQYSESVNDIIKNLTPQDQNKFINKLYATAVQKCEPIINQMEVMQFFTSANQNFDPSSMFHIFDGYNFYQLTLTLEDITPNQKSIIKFIKQFDAEMEVRKEQQQAQKDVQQRDEGVQLFFISLKNLSPQAKYLYILLVLLISGGILWYGFSQIGQKPVKSNKKKKKQQ